MTNEAGHAASGTVSGPAPNMASGGRVRPPMTFADSTNRRDALKHAVALPNACVTRPERIIAAAAALEDYLRDGVTPPEKPKGPKLPLGMASRIESAPEHRLYILSAVLKERIRQEEKGYDAANDDGHADEAIAIAAAHAIAPYSAGIYGKDGKLRPGWVGVTGKKREHVLIQGIALAVAELERIERVRQREADEADDHRTDGDTSAVSDEPRRPHGDPNKITVAVNVDGNIVGSDLKRVSEEKWAMPEKLTPRGLSDRIDGCTIALEVYAKRVDTVSAQLAHELKAVEQSVQELVRRVCQPPSDPNQP